MSQSSLNFRDSRSDHDVSERQHRVRPREQSFADSLKRIVRRVLRTQSHRTSFEAWVLEEARRVMDGHFCELARDTLERLVVDRLLLHRDGHCADVALQGAGPVCPATQLNLPNSTFALQAGAA
jgi:hypothetical protein